MLEGFGREPFTVCHNLSESSSKAGNEQSAGRPESRSLPVDLSCYTTGRFDRGAGVVKEGLWLVVSLILFRLCPFSFSALKRAVLRVFGANIGRNVTIKPQVNITFPWKLTVGDHVWLGEEVWLLNLERIVIGSNVCISQRAYLCTGSHDYKRTTFDLIVKPITVENGAWLGAGCWIGPGVKVGSHAVLSAGSVSVKNLAASGIYRGNPAVLVKQRVIS
jgi:putative colanic acid biosynthesis acetyltransferase WcaF